MSPTRCSGLASWRPATEAEIGCLHHKGMQYWGYLRQSKTAEIQLECIQATAWWGGAVLVFGLWLVQAWSGCQPGARFRM